MSQKLDIGQILSRVFTTYREQAGVLLPAAFIVFLVTTIVTIVLILIGASVGGVVGAILGGVVALLLSLVGVFFFQGMVVQLVRDIQDGRRDSTVSQLFQSVSPAVPSIFGYFFLVALIGIALGIVTILISAVAAPLGVLVGLVLFIGLAIVVGIFWAVVVPVLVVERPGITAALSRSRNLVRGNELQVLAIVIILGLIVGIARAIFMGIIGGIDSGQIGDQIGALIANTLTVPLTALAAPTMYFALLAIKGEASAVPAAAAPAAVVPGTAPATAPPGAAPAPQAPPGEPVAPPPPSSQPPPPPPPPAAG